MADECLEEVSSMDFSKLKVPDLKKELKSRGLSTSGNKNDLLERLQSALKSHKTVLTDESIDDIEEDLLNEDDDDEEEEHLDEAHLNDLDALEELPKAQKRKLEPEPTIPAKKVVLNRAVADNLTETKKEPEKPAENTSTEDEKKTIKLSEISVKERLEMRAKKFGVISLNDDAKKQARAERFGASTNTNSKISLDDTNTSLDVLKKRAARFGSNTSSIVSSLENKEKMEKRKERFAITLSSGKDQDAAKAARLERFKVK